MVKLNIESNAKINLGLNITGKTENNYHLLDMIMAPINLSDKLEIIFFEKEGNLEIKTNKKYVPTDCRNIIYKIYNEYYYNTGLQKQKVGVYLNKTIPSQAGLGGGSSNGAFFLKALNEFHNNYLSLEEMINLGKKIGADIPFFLINKTSRAKGIGEELEVLENNLDSKVLLIKPRFGISTVEAYKGYNKLTEKKWADIEKVIVGLKDNNIYEVNSNIENHLQQSALFLDKRIKSFEEELKKIDTNFKMSGSGSCYYLLTEKETSQELYIRVKEKFNDCFICLADFI